MIKARLFSLVAAVALTTGTFSAVSADVPTQQARTLEQYISFCSVAYADFKKHKNANVLNEGMKVLTPSQRNVAAIVCASYGVGFENGIHWIGNLS